MENDNVSDPVHVEAGVVQETNIPVEQPSGANTSLLDELVQDSAAEPPLAENEENMVPPFSLGDTTRIPPLPPPRPRDAAYDHLFSPRGGLPPSRRNPLNTGFRLSGVSDREGRDVPPPPRAPAPSEDFLDSLSAQVAGLAREMEKFRAKNSAENFVGAKSWEENKGLPMTPTENAYFHGNARDMGRERNEAFQNRGTRRMTMGAAATTHTGPNIPGQMSYAITGTKARLQTPHLFDGTYTEEYNILNWIIMVERYLYNCGIPEEMYSSYAYTYLIRLVQAWFDHMFFSNPVPPWDLAVTKFKIRYLPIDHVTRLLRKFAAIRQLRSLREYSDKFQILVSAMNLTNISKSQEELVRQYIDGVQNFEDRMTMLTQKCDTLEHCYGLATLIQGARQVPSGYSERSPGNNRNIKDQKRFNRLEGAAKKAAFEKGNCLECGKSGHFWRKCPDLKPKSYRFEKKTERKKKKVFKLEAPEPEQEEEETQDPPIEEKGADDSSEEGTPNGGSDSSEGEESD